MAHPDPAPGCPLHGCGMRLVADQPRGDGAWQPRRYSAFDVSSSVATFMASIAGPTGSLDGARRQIVLKPLGAFDRAVPPGSALYDRLAEPVFGEHDAAELRALGRMLKWPESDEQPSGTCPAGYTYLGQFIAHDMSRMDTGEGVERPINRRTAALDLDSVFGAPGGPGEESAPAALALGPVDGAAALDDLPRDAAGEPQIPEPRNDHNVGVAQVHVAMIKFHQTVERLCGREQARALTLRHFQSVVLHDYLGRICDPEVHDDVLRNGRAVVLPRGTGGVFELPIEFAAACFRFGHSMVRATYPNWNAVDPEHPGEAHAGTPFDRLIENTWLGGGLGASRNRLPGHWATRWENLVEFPGRSPANLSSPIDTHFSARLVSLRPWMIRDLGGLEDWSDSERRNLGALTLFRGLTLGLPTGERLAEHLNKALERRQRPRIAVLSSAEVAAAAGEHLAGFLHDHAAAFANRTPLWLYVLCEARARHGGARLGPLGSRVVMETIHAAIEATPGGIVAAHADGHQEVGFVPDDRLGSADGRTYSFPDLLGCVARHWRPH